MGALSTLWSSPPSPKRLLLTILLPTRGAAQGRPTRTSPEPTPQSAGVFHVASSSSLTCIPVRTSDSMSADEMGTARNRPCVVDLVCPKIPGFRATSTFVPSLRSSHVFSLSHPMYGQTVLVFPFSLSIIHSDPLMFFCWQRMSDALDLIILRGRAGMV